MAALAAIFLLKSNNAEALQVSVEEQDTSAVSEDAELNPNINDTFYEEPQLSNNADANRAAFLFMIRACEHVYPRDVLNNDCYNIFYAGSRFDNMSDHPVITKEKRGVVLPDSMCAASGLNPGCVSTAAGAYQIIKPTWIRVRSAGPYLEDFSVASQDEAALRLLDECGALALIDNGDINGAIQRASKVWASLPGSTAQQNPKKVEFAMNRFNDGLTA